MSEEVLLRVENLETSFFTGRGQLKAVNGISYDIHKGETVGIVGESGCGKSVTSLSIMRLLDDPGRVTGGRILFKGRDLLKLSESEMETIRGNKIAMIFQEPMTALNPVLTIGQQIDEPILKHKKEPNARAARARTVDLLNLVGIPSAVERADQYPHQLSGGMRQRAMIAMALSCEPELLIADEPTTALDVTIQAQILDLIQDLQSKFGTAVQFITHDLGVISEVADRVVVMYAGRVCEKATTEEIFHRPRHPYTNALLNSRPPMGRKVRKLDAIPGSVPTIWELPRGCAFQNRCAFAKDICKVDLPELQTLGQTQEVACYSPLQSRELAK